MCAIGGVDRFYSPFVSHGHSTTPLHEEESPALPSLVSVPGPGGDIDLGIETLDMTERASQQDGQPFEKLGEEVGQVPQPMKTLGNNQRCRPLNGFFLLSIPSHIGFPSPQKRSAFRETSIIISRSLRNLPLLPCSCNPGSLFSTKLQRSSRSHHAREHKDARRCLPLLQMHANIHANTSMHACTHIHDHSGVDRSHIAFPQRPGARPHVPQMRARNR
jgi:hypothetical protein